METTRAWTLTWAREFQRKAEHCVKEGKTVKAGGFSRFIWMVAGIIGACFFVASFGVALLPLITPISWIHSTVSFVGMQWSAQVFMDLPEYWMKASAYFWMTANYIRRRKPKDIFNKANLEAASPASYGLLANKAATA